MLGEHIWLSVIFFFFKFIYLFWEKESGRGAESENPSTVPCVEFELTNCEVMTWAETKSQMFNQLSHPGAPLLLFLSWKWEIIREAGSYWPRADCLGLVVAEVVGQSSTFIHGLTIVSLYIQFLKGLGGLSIFGEPFLDILPTVGIYEKPTTNIKLNGKRLNAFPLISGTRQECLFSPPLFSRIL